MIDILKNIFEGKYVIKSKNDEQKKKRCHNDDRSMFDKILTVSEVKKIKNNEEFKCFFDIIPKEFNNKSFVLGDYTIHFVNSHEIYDKPEPSNMYTQHTNYGYRSEYYKDENQTYVMIEFHGYVKLISSFRDRLYLELKHGLPTQTNWHWLTFTEERGHLLEEYWFLQEHEYNENFQEFINLLISNNEKIESDLKIKINDASDSWDIKYKDIKKHNVTNIDLKWFILNDTTNNVFKPNEGFRDLIGVFGSKNPYKNLFTELKINTIHFTTKSHFDVIDYFKLNKKIEVKAPKSIIKRYGLERYCKDDETIKTISNEKKIVEEKEKYFEHHNKFSLVQHGKVILDNVDKYDVLVYLENHKVKYPYVKVKIITKDSNIPKEVRQNLQDNIDSVHGDSLTFGELFDLITSNWCESTNDNSYYYDTFNMETDKYIFEVVGKRYIKDQLICDREFEEKITIKQLF